MKRSFFFGLFLYLAVGVGWLCPASTDEYWISFGGEPTEDFRYAPKYLMKIDVFGNIVVQPTKIVVNRSVTRTWGATAIAPGGATKLNMWFPKRKASRKYRLAIVKAVVDNSSQQLVSIGPTTLTTRNEDYLSVSQKPANNFIVVDDRIGITSNLIAYSTADPSKSWLLVEGPIAIGGDFSFAVSADGRALVYARRNDSGAGYKVFFQPLGSGGRSVGQPEMVVRGRNLRVDDVSGPLKGKRYALYQYSSSLFLQKVDERTGAKIGEKIRIAGNLSQAAIDPLGHFVIYISARPSIKTLLFQALDALGQPSGSPRIIATGVGWGLDILKD